jgi:hypothetical protein
VADYFVSAAGDDTDSGLVGFPWETIPKVNAEFAASTFAAGDTISFNRGDSWDITDSNDRLNIGTVGGAIGNHIVIGAYGSGADPVFDGGGGETVMIDVQSSYITIQDIEVMDWDDAGGIRIGTNGTVRHHIILNRLYVHDMTATSWGAAIRVRYSAKQVWVLNCTVEDIRGEGVYFGRADTGTDLTKQCWVHNCSISRCSEGIDIKDATTEIYVTNCTFVDNGQGISPAVDTGQISLGGRFNVIYNCRFTGAAENNQRAINSGRYQGGGFTNSGKYNTIERCLFVGCTGAQGAIRAGGVVTGEGNRITNCTFVDCSIGIYCDAADAGYVIRNCIFSGETEYPVYIASDEADFDFDYNDYSDGDSDVWFEDGAARDLAAYVQGTLGQESNGISTAANFAETGMYTLTVGSGAIDTGESSATVYDWNDEYAPSGAVDMGWREYNYASVNEGLGGLPHRIFRSRHNDSAAFGRYSGTVGAGITVAGNVPTPVQGLRSINVAISDTTDRYANRTGLGDLAHFFASIEVDVDSLAMANGDVFDVFQGLTGGATAIMRIQINYDGSNIRARVGLLTDAAAWTNTSYYNLSAGWNHIEAFWSAAPDVATNDGQIALWVNDVEEEHVDTANNHNNLVDEFRVGTVDGLDAGTSGTLYIDVVRLDWLRYMSSAVSTTTYLYTTVTATVVVPVP